MAGIFGVLTIVFIVAVFVVFLNMIPNVEEWIQTTFATDEFGSQILLFIGLIAGIGIFSWLGMMYMPKKR